jgi:glycosyltransferase involved in cell wall biosynthesis
METDKEKRERNIPVYSYDGTDGDCKVEVTEGYRTPIIVKQGPLNNRLLIGVPMTGLVRAEWMLARYGQVIPCNWSQSEVIQWIDQLGPINFMVADARNLIACAAVEAEFEWLLFIDHDVILPPGFFIRVNERMIKKKIPVWSGLYFTKSLPSEPLIYRNNGGGYYPDWNLGDEVWVTGIPMGCTVIHVSILKAMYDEAESYALGNKMVRKIFTTPSKVWFDPEIWSWQTNTGTEDLRWCDDVISKGIFEKAGWPEYQKMENPFLVDTGMYCKHIDPTGRQYPMMKEETQFLKHLQQGVLC